MADTDCKSVLSGANKVSEYTILGAIMAAEKTASIIIDVRN
jgi:hypothetical protein